MVIYIQQNERGISVKYILIRLLVRRLSHICYGNSGLASIVGQVKKNCRVVSNIDITLL